LLAKARKKTRRGIEQGLEGGEGEKIKILIEKMTVFPGGQFQNVKT